MVIPTDYSLIWILNIVIMCYLYVYICLWMYWITNIMISMYMYLVMLYPINALIWLYATITYHVYWNVSDNRVICHICIPYNGILYTKNFLINKFLHHRYIPFDILKFICIAVFCSKCLPLWLESQTDQAHVPQSFFLFFI